ncbi:MAG: ROK family protein [Gemmatimonadota bacterium]|nr:ROK family protein [Gemmatimonadota bacterium]
MILAVDIGGTNYSLALGTSDGRIHKRTTGSTNRSGGAQWMIERVLKGGGRLIASSPEAVSACGISFGGPVDFASQRIVNSTHVSGWDNLALTETIQGDLGIPAIVDNDANAGALGELTFGAGRGCRHLVYYNVGTGIGAGIIINGEIYRGANGNAGELGHVPVNPDGPLCDCGNRGCLESLCSGTAIGRRGEEAVRRQPWRGGGIRQAAGGPVTARAVFDAARSGDGLALELVNETCRYLGMGVAAAMNALAPEAIVIGGSVAKAGRALLEPLRELTDRFLMPVHRPHLTILPARLKGNSGLLGAVALAATLQTEDQATG